MNKRMAALKATAEGIGIRWGTEEKYHVTVYFGESPYRESKRNLSWLIGRWKAWHDAGDRSWFAWNAKVFAPGYEPEPSPFMKWLTEFLAEHTEYEALAIFREAEVEMMVAA
jgi:hypothetical protein